MIQLKIIHIILQSSPYQKSSYNSLASEVHYPGIKSQHRTFTEPTQDIHQPSGQARPMWPWSGKCGRRGRASVDPVQWRPRRWQVTWLEHYLNRGCPLRVLLLQQPQPHLGVNCPPPCITILPFYLYIYSSLHISLTTRDVEMERDGDGVLISDISWFFFCW